MYNHNKAQQSKNRVHISWDILYSRHMRMFLFKETVIISLRCLHHLDPENELKAEK